jgi:hypothetical protein
MEKKTKICPYNAEKFIPKRNNQKFASRYNQITYNNNKNRELQKHVKEVNKKLLKNYRIIVELLEDKQEMVFNTQYLRGKGFSFNILTFFIEDGDKTIYGIYNFAFYKFDNNQTKIIRQ